MRVPGSWITNVPGLGTNLNYLGSSGWGIDPTTGRETRMYTPPPSADPSPDYPVYSIASGKLVSRKTGKPWMGDLPSGWGGDSRGVQVPYAPPGTTINPNDASQRYKAVNITKQPDVAGAQQDLMQSFKDSAAASLKDFSNYLNNFKSDLGAARTAGAAATDITPTVNALQAGQSAYASGLTADQQQLADALNSNAAAERGIVSQAQGVLPQYDAAAKAVADQQMQAVMQNLSKYKLASGTPTSAGSDEAKILADAAARVYAPFEQSKINEQLNLLTGLALPVQQDITNRQTAALTQFNPAAQAAIWSSGRATAQDVQTLKNTVAGMTYQQALEFMQAAQVPATIQQQILSGQIGQLGGLSQLESGANYQGLQDLLGVYPSQPQGYSMATGGYPSYPVGLPNYGTGNSISAPGAPITVGPLGNIPGGIPYRPLPGSIGGAPYAYGGTPVTNPSGVVGGIFAGV